MYEADERIELWKRYSRIWEQRAKDNQKKAAIWASALRGVLVELENGYVNDVGGAIWILQTHIKKAENFLRIYQEDQAIMQLERETQLGEMK